MTNFYIFKTHDQVRELFSVKMSNCFFPRENIIVCLLFVCLFIVVKGGIICTVGSDY